TFRLAQHQGVRNARPVAEALQAFKEWSQAILSFALPVNHDEVESYAAFAREHYRDQIHGTEVRDRARISWLGICGYEPHSHETLGDIWGIWKDVLAGDMARSNAPGTLFRLGETQEVVRTISPAAWLALKNRERTR